MKKIIYFIFFFTCIIVSFYTGCTVHSHKLDLHAVKQPIQMGALQFLQNDSLSHEFTQTQTISGDFVHEVDEGATSSDENSRLTIGGGEYAKQTLFSAIDSALQNRQNRFIADVQLSVEVEHGISIGAVLGSILGAAITEDETETGEFTFEKFYLAGKTYEIISNVPNE